METPVLDVSRYRKEYRGKVAVSDLSLAVAPGEICGFIGHNRAGKTMLIRSVVGRSRPRPARSASAAATSGASPWRPSASWPTCRTTPTFTTSSPARRRARGAPGARGRPRGAGLRLLPRHAPEARAHRRAPARPDASGAGRALRGARPERLPRAQCHPARARRRRRRGVLLVPCARGRGAALRHRGGDPPRRARRPRPDRRGARLASLEDVFLELVDEGSAAAPSRR